MQQKELLTGLDVANIGEAIDRKLAFQMIQTSKETYPDSFKGVIIGSNIIEHILAQPGCVGIHFYDAINEFGQKTLVYVGVDAAGKDMLEHVVVDQNGAISVVSSIVADRGWDELLTLLGWK
jgi:hypothetical protein